MVPNEKTVRLLNALIENSRQGSEAYRAVSKALQNDQLKSTFSNLERRHNQIVNQLEEQVRVLGATPSKAGVAENVWADLKSTLASADERSIITGLEKSETALETHFDKALHESSLPANIKEQLKQQHENQKDARDLIRDLKASM